jgi:type IV pilus modification protein PilV
VRQMYKLCRNSSGFTLIEALISIAIFAFGVLAVVTMLDVGFSAGTLAKNTTTATELAASMMDTIQFSARSLTDPLYSDRARLTSFHNMNTSAAAPVKLPASSPQVFVAWQTLVQQNLPQGRGLVTVVQNADASLQEHYTVTVQVFWTTVLQRSVTFQSEMIVSL